MNKKRFALSALMLSMALVGGLAVGPVHAAAQSGTQNDSQTRCDPQNAESNCPATDEDYKGMLENLYEIGRLTLKYAGFITVFAGATLWFTARRSSDRASTGVWLLIGGFAMIVFYFGFTGFISLLKFIASPGSSAGST